MQLVGDRSVAEDLAQEVFLRLYKQPPDDLSKVGSWLHRTLTRLSYDYMQKQARQRKLEERVRSNNATLQVVHPSSEQLALKEFESDTVRRTLLQLSERDRKALLLKQTG
jgi:RNA polymerase sigma factor (sigma-70 family)